MTLWKYGVVAFVAPFALFGQFILRYLNISLPAMQGAGGLLLVLVSLELLTGKDSDPSTSAGVNVALVLLGTPLLAGPGLVLRSSTVVMRILRESGVNLVARIAGLLLSAIAVQMIADSIRAFIKVG